METVSRLRSYKPLKVTPFYPSSISSPPPTKKFSCRNYKNSLPTHRLKYKTTTLRNSGGVQQTPHPIATFLPSSYIFRTNNFLAKTLHTSTSLAEGSKQIGKSTMWNVTVDSPRISNVSYILPSCPQVLGTSHTGQWGGGRILTPQQSNILFKSFNATWVTSAWWF